MAIGCIFCEIVAGRIDASLVYEDDLVLAFLDVAPSQSGHTLIVPREHVGDIYALDDLRLSGALLSAAARVSRALRRVLAPDGVNVWQSTGAAAGQEVFHLHLHVLPRYDGDELLQFNPSKRAHPSRTELEALATRLRDS